MKETKKMEEELKELKKQSEKKGAYISALMSAGIISAGLFYTLYDNKVGVAIVAGGLIPMLIKPENLSGNKRKIANLENEINKLKSKKSR